MTLRSAAVLAFVGCVWGGSFLFIRVAVDEVEPLQLVFFRAAMGAITLLLIARARHIPLQIDRRGLAVAVLLAFVGAFLPFLLITWAGTQIESGSSAVLNGTMPLFVLIVAAAALPEEEMTWQKSVGVALGFIGVLVLMGDHLRSLTDSSFAGQAAVLLASALYGVTAVIMRRSVRRWSAQTICTLQITLLALMSTALLPLDPPSFNYSADTWLSLMALGLLGTGVAYVAYYWLIENVGSVRASLVAYIIPIVGVAAGAIVLGEDVPWNTFAGGAVILLGVGVGNGVVRVWRPSRRVLQHSDV